MNLRWVHAVLILLSAALAVLFGVWCLGQYRRGERRRAAWSRPSPRSPCRSAWSSTTRGSCARRGRCDEPPSQLRGYGATRPAGSSDCDRRGSVADGGREIGGSSSVLACPVCFGAEETSMIDGAKLGVLVLLAITARRAGRLRRLLSLSPQAREAHRGHRARHGMVASSRGRREHHDELAWTPAARLGSRRADRQPDRLDPRVHVHPVRRVGSVLHLLPVPLPAIAQSGGELHRGQVAHVELSRGRRGPWSKRSSCSAFSIPLWAARVDRMPAGERSAGRPGHRRAVRLEHPLCRPRRDVRPHATSS